MVAGETAGEVVVVIPAGVPNPVVVVVGANVVDVVDVVEVVVVEAGVEAMVEVQVGTVTVFEISVTSPV